MAVRRGTSRLGGKGEFDAFVEAFNALSGKTGAEKTAALSEVEQKFLDATYIVPIFQHNEVSA